MSRYDYTNVVWKFNRNVLADDEFSSRDLSIITFLQTDIQSIGELKSFVTFRQKLKLSPQGER